VRWNGLIRAYLEINGDDDDDDDDDDDYALNFMLKRGKLL
jgi:hypothetical protein